MQIAATLETFLIDFREERFSFSLMCVSKGPKLP